MTTLPVIPRRSLAGTVGAAASTRAGTITYWITTVALAAELAVGAVWEIARIPYVRDMMATLGYPLYFAVLMGAWKVPGAVVLVAPGLARAKEWVYAGSFFVFSGAVVSHLAVGDGGSAPVAAAVYAVIVIVSWALRPPDRRDLPRRGTVADGGGPPR